MPKNKAQRRIDKTAGSGARTVSVVGGGSSGGGSATIEQHALSGSKHTGTLAESQAPWAVTDTEFSAHTSNANAHHNRQHSLLSTSDHTLTAGAYSIVGAVLDNTIGTLSIASSGDGIDVTKSGGQFTVAVDVTDLIGDGLTEDGSNNLKVRAGDGIALAGGFVTVDESYDYAWTGDHTWTGDLSSSPWVSGDLGTGWGIDTSAGSADFRSVYAESIVAKAFVVDATIVEKGSLTLTPQRATLAADFDIPGSITGSATLTVYDIEGVPGAAAFTSGTYVRLRVLSRASGLVVGDSWGTVTGYADQGDGTQTWTWTLRSGLAGTTVYAGAVALGYGSSGSGLIDMTTVQANSPYIDVSTWVTLPYVGSNHTTHARLGNLDGITDADIGSLSGWGLYTDNLVARGTIVGAGGDVVIDDSSGVNLQARTSSTDSVTYATELSWTTDPFAPASARDVARMYAAEYSSGGLVYHKATLALPSDGSDQQRLFFTTTGSASERAYLQLDAGATNRLIVSSVGADGSSGGELQFLADNVLLGNITIRPVSDSTTALGTASYKFSELHVDTLYAGTTSSTDTGHNHDDRYYTESEVDTLLAAKSDTTHTHAGYASSTHTHDDRYYTESEIDVTLADYYTSAEIDTTLANYSLVGHTHDSRYYTESETDALLATKAASSHTHDDRYYTESEVDSLIAALPTSGHTHDDRYYTEAEADALLATKASTSHTHDSMTSAGAITLTHDTNNYVNLVDGSGTYARINATGIQSVIPAFSSGVDRSGLDITWTGDINARDITAVNLSTFTFQRNQVAAVGTTLAVNSAGKLANEFALTTTGTTQTFDIADPESGSEQVFEIGDVVRISGMAYANVPTNAETASGSRALTLPFMPLAAIDRNQRLATAYLTITNADTSYNGYTRYTATYNDGPAYVAFLVGTGVVRWSGGMIVLSSDGDDYAPYIDVFNAGTTPWADGTDAKYVRMGRLDGLGVIAAEQYGIALGSDLDDSTAARIVASNLGLSLYKVDYTANNGTADTVSIASSGRVKFGTDVSDGSTTAFDFNPVADSLTISAAVTLEDDSAIGGDVTMQFGGQIRSTDLDQTPSTYAWWMNPQGLRFDTSVGGLEVGGTVADFAAGSGTHTPRIEFYDALASRPRASLRTITNPGASTYSPGDDIITTDLVAITDPTSENDIGVRLTVARDYGAVDSAYIGVFSRYGGFDNEVSMYGDIVRIAALGELDINTNQMFVRGGFSWGGGTDANDGQLYFVLNNLPTSATNLPAGAVWNDAGTLKIAE